MDDYLDDSTEDESTDGALGAADAGDEETSGPVKTGEMSPLELADMYRQSRINKSKAAADLKAKIERARNVILQQPTKQSKADWLLGVGSTLLAPGPVGRAGTLGESLGSLGKYVSDVSAQERKAKALQAQQLANFDLTAARAEASASKEDERALASMMNKYLAQKPAQKPSGVQAVEYHQGVLADPNATPQQKAFSKAWLEKQTYIAPQKGEPDPDRPSSTVISRVQQFANRNLSPVKAKLDAVNQAKILLNQAYTNPAATGQVDRFLAKLVGDSQLSSLEVKNIANVGSLPTRISDKISLFLSGTRTDLSLDDKKKILDSIEDYLGPQYNAQHDKVLDAFSAASDISPAAVSRVLGGKYTTEAERRRRKEAETKSKESPPEEPKKDEEVKPGTTKAGNTYRKLPG